MTLTPLAPGFLPLAEAARWAGVSVRTLKRWIHRGLPTYQAGPREKVLIRPADIDAFLTRRQADKPSLDALVEQAVDDLTAGQRYLVAGPQPEQKRRYPQADRANTANLPSYQQIPGI